MFDIVEATFSMKMDLYRQSDVQDVNTGAIKKEWIFTRSAPCSAKGMISLAEEKFNKRQFEDVAYFEPAYLKDFVAGPPKKLL